MHIRLIGIISSALLALAACGGGSSSAPVGTAPSAPTGLLAVAGNAQASVAFTAPSNTGSSAVTGYRVTSSPAGGVDRDAGSSALNHVVTGLSNGVAYTFTVTASNTSGSGAASSASNAVTPSLPAKWSSAGSLQTARINHTATLLPNGKVLVAGGVSMQGNGQTNPSAPVYLSSAELYDPTTKLWTSAGAMATARSGHTATVLSNGKVLVAGGVNTVGWTASVELYDFATNTWTTGSPLPATRSNHAAALLPNGKVLVMGGYDSSDNLHTGALLYDPSTATWATGGTMVESRSQHVASLLPNGKVLVVGGTGASVSQPGAELYDPTSNIWTTAAKPTIALSVGVSATVLPNGKLLCIQGYKPSLPNSTSPNAEIYDPTANTWTPAGALTTAHENHTATLLPNGTLVVIGGGFTSVHSATIYGTDVTEVYDPVANTWSLSGPLSLGPLLGHTATLLRTGAVLVVGGTQASGWWYTPSRAEAALYE